MLCIHEGVHPQAHRSHSTQEAIKQNQVRCRLVAPAQHRGASRVSSTCSARILAVSRVLPFTTEFGLFGILSGQGEAETVTGLLHGAKSDAKSKVPCITLPLGLLPVIQSSRKLSGLLQVVVVSKKTSDCVHSSSRSSPWRARHEIGIDDRCLIDRDSRQGPIKVCRSVDCHVDSCGLDVSRT